MLHLFLDKGYWFRAKRYGIGAGLPIKWQGWVLLLSYILAMAGIGQLTVIDAAMPRAFAFALFLTVTAGFLMIVHKRTEGGWRWRWGDGE